MIPEWANRAVYTHFDAFLQKSILNNDSYITDNPGVFTIENLNECVKCFSDNPDMGDGNFDDKADEQFADTSDEVNIVFAHFIWLWCLADSKSHDWGKRKIVKRFIGEIVQLEDVFVSGGIGSSGQRHKRQKPTEINYLLLLFRYIKKHKEQLNINDVNSLKTALEGICRALYYRKFDDYKVDDLKLRKAGDVYLAMHHILLHLCNPEKYEAIAAQKDKDAIINTFYSILDKENTEGLWDDIDDTIFKIRVKLSSILRYEINNFYNGDEIERAWNFGENKDDVSIDVLFEYKKAVIFYGPPGTSKTHSATRLAELLITKQYFRNKQNIKEYFLNSDKLFEDHIHHLQLHSNYNYEDFIAGIQIEEKTSVVKPGYLLNLIEKVKNDPLPHILILDEINRTDISRLFGELFSALEYRNKKIKLSIGELEIALPGNLYFIGTMNEIDFSLERIDFALRRRFLWQFKGFDKSILWNMIQQKNEELEMNINGTDIEAFIHRCEQLNISVSGMPELGENYQVGHTFFAEVVDIFKSLKSVHSGRLYFLNQPVNILWEISIKPILQAFLGNMDADSKRDKINELMNVLVNG